MTPTYGLIFLPLEDYDITSVNFFSPPSLFSSSVPVPPLFSSYILSLLLPPIPLPLPPPPPSSSLSLPLYFSL
jgi:hypothetical protein